MKLKVCGRFEVPEFAGLGFTHMISIGDSNDFFDGLRLAEIDPANHLILKFTDTDDSTHPDAPTMERLKELVSWLRVRDSIDGLLVHCAGGISRSPAVALLALCQLFPDSDPVENMELVARSAECTYIWPNRIVIAIGDQVLARRGEIAKAVATWAKSSGAKSADFI